MSKAALLLIVCFGFTALGFTGGYIKGIELQGFPIIRFHMTLEGKIGDAAMTLYEDDREVKIEYVEVKSLRESPSADIVFLIDNSRSISGFETLIREKSSELLQLLIQNKIDFTIAVIGFSDVINTVSFPKTSAASSLSHLNPFTSDPYLILETVSRAVLFNGNHPSKPFEMIAMAAGMPFREKATKMIILFSDECPVESLINPELYRALGPFLAEKKISLSIFYDFHRQSFYWDYYKRLAESSGGHFLDLNESLLFLPVLAGLSEEKMELWVWFRSQQTAFDTKVHRVQFKDRNKTSLFAPYDYRFPEEWTYLRLNTITATPFMVERGAPVFVKVCYYPYSEDTRIVFDTGQGFTLVERYEEAEALLLAPDKPGSYRIPVTVSRGKESLDGCVVVHVN